MKNQEKSGNGSVKESGGTSSSPKLSGGGTSASSKSGKGTSSAQKLGSRIIPASRSTKNGGK